MTEVVEIPKAQLGVLQAAYQLLNGMYTGPKATEFKRLLKQHDPEGKLVKTPDVDLADEVAKPLKDDIATLREENSKLLKRLDDRDKAEKDDKALRDMHSKIDEVVASRKLTKEGREGLIKTMQERQIADPEAAALVYLDKLPKPEPAKAGDASRYLPQKINIFESANEKGQGDANTEEWFKDPIGKFDKEVAAVLNEAAA